MIIMYVLFIICGYNFSVLIIYCVYIYIYFICNVFFTFASLVLLLHHLLDPSFPLLNIHHKMSFLPPLSYITIQ